MERKRCYVPHLYLCRSAHRPHSLLELTHLEKKYGLKARLLGKLEYLNPAGSVKDRIARAMIDDAEVKGPAEARQRYHRAYFR